MTGGCVNNIADCFRNGCADRFDPENDEASYDLCITNPSAIAYICRQQLLDCSINVGADNRIVAGQQGLEHPIWTFVVRRMSAMRDNACVREVRACMARDTNCGPTFSNCMGMDTEFITRMCPQERMVSCAANGQQAPGSTDARTGVRTGGMDADAYWDLISGILLNVDNAMLTACQAAVEAAMNRICGSTDDCTSLFEGDSDIGTEGMTWTETTSQVNILGLISRDLFETAADGAANLRGTGESTALRMTPTHAKADLKGTDATNRSLDNIALKINNRIMQLLNDEQVQMCVNGRDLTQITRSAAAIAAREERQGHNRAEARFPHIADSAIMVIMEAGIDRAMMNHDKKKTELISKALERATEIMTAQAQSGMCFDPAISDPTGFLTIDRTEAITDGSRTSTGGTNNATLIGTVIAPGVGTIIGEFMGSCRRGNWRQAAWPNAQKCQSHRAALRWTTRWYNSRKICGGFNFADFDPATMEPTRPNANSICWQFRCRAGLGFPVNADGTVNRARCAPCSGPNQNLVSDVCWERNCVTENAECRTSPCIIFNNRCMPICTSNSLSTSFNTSDPTAMVLAIHGIQTGRIPCPAGTFLPANTAECITCTASHYCPGGNFAQSSTNQGQIPCPTGRSSSPGSTAIENCTPV